VDIEKSKRFCKKHRKKKRICIGFVEELKSKTGNYERMMKLNDSIIQFQQQQIDELLERNQELRKEKQWLERKIELLEVEKDARFN
jgi:hypothetical protein